MFTVSFLGEGSPTKVDYRKKGTLILTSLLEDLVGASRLAFKEGAKELPGVVRTW